MTKLPSSRVVIQILSKHGFLLVGQKGSHQKFTNGDKTVILTASKKEFQLEHLNLSAGSLAFLSKNSLNDETNS